MQDQGLRRRVAANDQSDAPEGSTASPAPPRRPLAGCTALLALLAGALLLAHRITTAPSQPGATIAPLLLTPEGLGRFTGQGRSRIYVAVLGSVFDVTSGRRHYGPGGAYGFFAGRDATRGFVTGDFRGDLTDDVRDFTPEQHAEAVRWRDFYSTHKDYRQVGRVIGRCYDADGDPTPLLLLAETQAERFAAEKAAKAANDEKQHLCNVSWSRVKGGWVYCDEGRRPRRVLTPVAEQGEGEELQERCQCLDDDEVSAARRLYEGCAPDSARCQTSPPEAEE